jgi:hypothetical protein
VPGDCGCHDLYLYDLALGHAESTMASGAAGEMAKKIGFLTVATDDAEVGYANVRVWEYETETDEEDHLNEKSGRWKAFCHVSEANGIAEGCDIADAVMK